MTKQQWFGIGYVSVWVVIWGSVGSLIDLPLLNAELYVEGSIGQITTFALTAIVSGAVGAWLYPRVLSSSFVVAALGLDTDQAQ